MERTRANSTTTPAPQEPVIRWKKLGGGSLRIGRRIIKPGEVFKATKSEIPRAFKDMVIPLENLPAESPEVAPQPANPPVTLVYTKVPVDNPAGRVDLKYFNVVDVKGKVLNEKPLTELKAGKLINDLSQ